MGVLSLAVALSHFLKLSILSKPKKNSLLIDGIYYNGYIHEKTRNIEGSETHVWISKKTYGVKHINI